ncbi:Nif3-like dinuclear metal center hexameric protein [Companilactobacillus sp. DQM5]|uniref:Nif3-like dinuclear metal center hexameric protein n=1 Tax=Companilactobacillus sp. DQM5 TaxID=3463359 RepID=UPI004059651F
MTNIQDIIDKIEEFAPLSLKEENDPTGFQIGNRSKEIKKIMTTLDVRPNVVKEAIEKNVDLIIAHHPIMFRPVKNLDITNPQNKMYYDLIQNDISVHSAHTNIDKTMGGMNDWLSNKIGLTNIKPIEELNGLGRIGEVTPISLSDFSEQIKEKFNLSGLRVIKSEEKLVHKVAIIGGDGGKFHPIIKQLGADTFITGDVYYHTAHDMQSLGLNVIDPGHHIESIFISKMSEKIKDWSKQNNWNIDIIQSESNTEPFWFI